MIAENQHQASHGTRLTDSFLVLRTDGTARKVRIAIRAVTDQDRCRQGPERRVVRAIENNMVSSTGAFGRIRGGNELEKVREDDVGSLGCSLDGRFRDNEAGL